MFKDRAIETIQAGFTGTGTYNLGGAATNSQALDAAFTSGATLFYVVRTATWSKVEIGYGVVTSGSPDTLTRNVKRSYNGSTWGTSAVDWQVGDHTLYVYSAPVGEELGLMRRTHRGTSAPTPNEAGLLWEDTSGGVTATLLKISDGTDWITIGTVNETANTFAASGNYVPLAGGTMTGALQVNSTIGATGNISSASGGNSVTLTGSDGSIEILRTAGAAYIDLKNNSGDDFDVRIAQSGANGLAITAADGVSVSAGLTATGAITASGGLLAIGGLSNFQVYNNSSNAAFQGDSNDILFYNRGSNFWSFFVGSAAKLDISASTVTLGSGMTLTGSNGTLSISSNDTLGTRVYTVATLPSAGSNNWRIAFASDASGDKKLVFSDTGAWRYPDGVAV